MVMKEDEINSFIEHNTLFKKKLPLLKGHVLFKGVYGLNDVEEETQDARWTLIVYSTINTHHWNKWNFLKHPWVLSQN